MKLGVIQISDSHLTFACSVFLITYNFTISLFHVFKSIVSIVRLLVFWLIHTCIHVHTTKKWRMEGKHSPTLPFGVFHCLYWLFSKAKFVCILGFLCGLEKALWHWDVTDSFLNFKLLDIFPSYIKRIEDQILAWYSLQNGFLFSFQMCNNILSIICYLDLHFVHQNEFPHFINTWI